jgi:hypothetical protein
MTEEEVRRIVAEELDRFYAFIAPRLWGQDRHCAGVHRLE